MGDAAGELADRLQLLGMVQAGLGLVAFGERGLDAFGEQVVDVHQVAFGLFLVGDVHADADEADEHAARPIAGLGDRADPSPGAVASAIAGLEGEDLAGGFARHLLLEDARQVLGVQALTPVEVQGRLVGDAEEVDIGLVDEFAPPVGHGDPQQHRGAVGQGAETGVAFPHLFKCMAPFGDVDIDAYGADRLAGAVLQHLAAREHPADLAVGPQDAIFGGGELARPDGRHVALAHPFTVFRMHRAEQGADIGVGVRRQAEDAVEGRGPVALAGGDVPVPEADLAGLLGHLQARLAAVQGGLGLVQAQDDLAQGGGDDDGDGAGERVEEHPGARRALRRQAVPQEKRADQGPAEAGPAPALAREERGRHEGREVGDREGEGGVPAGEQAAHADRRGHGGKAYGEGRPERRRSPGNETQRRADGDHSPRELPVTRPLAAGQKSMEACGGWRNTRFLRGWPLFCPLAAAWSRSGADLGHCDRAFPIFFMRNAA